MILIVEDNPNIREELSRCLSLNGHSSAGPADFNCTQEELFDQVRKLMEENPVELLLLDINLQECDGLKLCREIRSISTLPIIFVTGRADETDELSGILMGGDDFIRKPYSIPVLMARVNRILARKSQAPAESVFAGCASLNVLMGQISAHGATLELSKNEVKILYYLFLNKGHIVSKDSLIEYLWENKFYVDENILNVNLSRLRRRLKEIGLQDLIITVPKQGLMVES
ncbi:response regulator transcription factor [Murimonas intestini]|uniref:response regulator transcription factor n=1 Tax=Murimonas intestini TaxID=1337051 RepID=UPI0016523967|nr:response regulator transcription factor [Murimonas intestini]